MLIVGYLIVYSVQPMAIQAKHRRKGKKNHFPQHQRFDEKLQSIKWLLKSVCWGCGNLEGLILYCFIGCDTGQAYIRSSAVIKWEFGFGKLLSQRRPRAVIDWEGQSTRCPVFARCFGKYFDGGLAQASSSISIAGSLSFIAICQHLPSQQRVHAPTRPFFFSQ